MITHDKGYYHSYLEETLHAQQPGTRACDAQKHQDLGKHRVRGVPWEEIDREAGEWRIPGERMKHQREHRVPMSGRALEILDAAGEGTARTGLVFPSPTGRVLRDLVFNRLLHELEIQAGGPPRSTTNTVASVSASLPAVSIGPKRLSGSGRGGGARPN